MKRRFLKKITVSARFNMKYRKSELKPDELELLWRTYLSALAKTNQISKYQSRTWKVPNKIL